MMKKRTKYLLFSLVLVLIALAVFAAVKLRPEKAKPKIETIKEFSSSDFIRASAEPLSALVELTGSLNASHTLVLRAKAAGNLLALSVKEGDWVKAGQVLGQIDISDLRIKLLERESLVEASRLNLNQLENLHQANSDLQKQGFLSAAAVKTSAATLESARAQLKSAQAQLVLVQKQLKESHILAPMSGVVGKRSALLGETLSVDQELLTLLNLDRLEFKAYVDPALAVHLQKGRSFELAIDGQKVKTPAHLNRVGPSADASNRMLPVVLDVNNTDHTLWPGQLGRSEFIYPLQKTGLTLAAEAIQEESGKTVVWCLEQGQLIRKTVLIGAREPRSKKVQILEGLGADDLVLAQRYEGLREGLKIKVNVARSTP